MNDRITQTMVETFIRLMENEEFAPGSIDKYSRDVRRFAAWLQQRPLCKEEAVSWKQSLLEKGYANTTINGMIVAVNRFFPPDRKRGLPAERTACSAAGVSQP